jgi:hypothetical protein
MEVLGRFLGGGLGEVLKQAECSPQEGDNAAAIAAEAAVRWCVAMGEGQDQLQPTLDFVLGLLGDPRRHVRQRRWASPRITEATKELVERWLSIQTIEAFFRVVDATIRMTGDDRERQMWAERRRFWMGYVQNVRKAWLICASAAAGEARQLRVQYGSFIGTGVLPDHSGLMLEIGARTGRSLVVLEMSYVGRAAFWSPDNGSFPKPYEREYVRSSIITDARSGIGGSFALTHHASWQGKFRDRILEETGVEWTG